MTQRGYVQSSVGISQCGEPILPPVMPAPMAMECQILAAKGNHRYRRDRSPGGLICYEAVTSQLPAEGARGDNLSSKPCANLGGKCRPVRTTAKRHKRFRSGAPRFGARTAAEARDVSTDVLTRVRNTSAPLAHLALETSTRSHRPCDGPQPPTTFPWPFPPPPSPR
jgi:hypothetical protein